MHVESCYVFRMADCPGHPVDDPFAMHGLDILSLLNARCFPSLSCEGTLWQTNIAIENGPVEIVSFPIQNGGSFHSFLLTFTRG